MPEVSEVKKQDTVYVKDIMSKEVIYVNPETTLLKAAKLIFDHNFNGMPVVDDKKVLVGVITEYDLITKSSVIDISTLKTVLEDIHLSLNDNKSEFKKEVVSVDSVTVGDIMNREPMTLPESASLDDAIKIFREHHQVNPIPVIDSNRVLVGVISRYDVLKPLNILNYSIELNSNK